MAEVSDDNLVEQILVRSDVKDLIRFKIVCKSWYSLITSPRFINRHLNCSYNKDRYDNELCSRRVLSAHELSYHSYRLVGSSNGLVCIISDFRCKLLVGNPLTRETRELRSFPGWKLGLSLCWGFGYDSSRDDYKVIVGAGKGYNKTRVRVLSLKSNVWRVIGDVKYTFSSVPGILCNGALHWIIRDENMKMLIISYDLCKEEFKEIPQPGNARYKEGTTRSRLGL